MPEEIPIPERWKEHYEACKDNLAWKQDEGKAGHTQQIKIQLIEELGAAEQQIKLIHANTTDLIAAAENRTHKAEEKLEALQWKRITPEAMPSRGDEVMAPPTATHGALVFQVGFDARPGDDVNYTGAGFIYYRPINPPAEQPEVEAGK